VLRKLYYIPWWAATLFILLLSVNTCQTPAYAICACSSPEEVYESAVSRDWIYVQIVKSVIFPRIEVWTKDDRFVEVYYQKSVDIDYLRLCYYGETGHMPDQKKNWSTLNDPNPF
jgi:hypothetical protein